MITYMSLQQDGETALHYACEDGAIRSAVQLIEAGADLQVTNEVKKKNIWRDGAPRAVVGPTLSPSIQSTLFYNSKFI